MDFLIEFILELVLEGTIELGTNKKVPPIIRYPLLFVIFLGALFLFFGIFSLALATWKKNIYLSFLLYFFDFILVIGVISKIRKAYEKKK